MSIFGSISKLFEKPPIESSEQFVQSIPPADTAMTNTISQPFIDNGDGTATDTRTGLMWMRFAEGQEWCGDTSTGQAKRFSLDEAKAIRRNFAGFDDWRLPTVDELKSIFDPSRVNPAFDSVVFHGFDKTPNPLFWSSSSAGTDQWWYVSFYSGSSFTCELKTTLLANPTNSVRLVRDSSDCRNPKLLQVTLNQVETEPVKSELQLQPIAASSPRFIDNGDGTVWDTQTGLMWMRCAVRQRWDGGKCTGSPHSFPWQKAAALNHSFAGYDDWRLPEIKELESIIDRDQKDPAIDTNIFPSTPCSSFWSSTASKYPGAAWMVHFGLGFSDSISGLKSCHVRFVRKIRPISNVPMQNHILANSNYAEELVPETLKKSLRTALTECVVPRGDLVNFVHKNPLLINAGLFDNGRTLLHLATRAGKLKIVEWLVLKGAKVNVADLHGATPSDLATGAGAKHTADYLRSKLPSLETLAQIETKPANTSQIQQTATSDNARYIDNGDGTVVDTQTGLMWMRCAVGQMWNGEKCTGSPQELSWQHPSVIKHSFAGYDDWRVPDLLELRSLVDHQFGRPAIDTNVFSGLPGEPFFWSNSRVSGNPKYASLVNFITGEHFAGRMGAAYRTRLVRNVLFCLQTSIAGTGLGTVAANPEGGIYIGGSRVRLVATPQLGSVFTGWSDDAVGNDLTRTLLMTGDKQITAHFEKKSFYLHVEQTGTGSGAVNINPALVDVNDEGRQSHPAGTSVMLMAEPAPDSVFIGWNGEASGAEPRLSILMDTDKSVSANFKLKSFALSITHDGGGSGAVTCFPDGSSHSIGSLLTLSAIPNPGSVFVGWSGDLTESAPTCTLVMDSAKTVTANFSRLSFALEVTKSGSGTGSIARSLEAESYDHGSIVTITAQADDGSIFNGWRGDAEGLDASCTIQVDSAKRVTAEFVKLDIPDLGIRTTFDSAEKSGMKSGDEAFILYLAIANNGQKQIHIELPLSSYVTRHGEEIEQDAWLTGLINGAQGATLRSGTFRKVGLVFFTSKLRGLSAGDHLHLTVAETKPARRFNFTFRCTDQQSRAFTLIDAIEEAQIQVAEEVVASSPDTAAMLQRIELLESGLSGVLRQLEALQTSPHVVSEISASENATVPTLADVLAWLATQERVSLADLRSRLLPLDLLPSAVIDELNERALDLTGEIAFEESGEDIIIIRAALVTAIVNLEQT